MKVYNKKILASILFVIVGTVCLAQVDNPPPPEIQDTPPGLPIDGLTTLFVAIGAFYGVRKVIQNSNEH